MEWDKITDIILITALVILGIFACLGLFQLITRRSLKKVDKQILWLIVPTLLMVAVWFLCDKILPTFIPNYPTRPDGSGEPSFPSTHVMFVTTIFFCISAALPKYTKSKTAIFCMDMVMFILASLVATGRVLANKHSVFDVIGAVIFSFMFYEIYYALIRRKKTQKEVAKHE